ncbi:MAG: DUF1499 domain-containing protein [Brevinematales bacterium]|jgi:uncharacterized protein (DUF1499 family)
MKKDNNFAWVSIAGFIIGITALLLFAAAAMGNRMAFLQTFTVVRLVFFSMIAGFAATGISILGIILSIVTGGKKGYLLGTAGIILGLIIAGGPWNLMSKHMPRIHDITTDTQDPPVFADVIPLRVKAANNAAYEGGETAALQEKFYPDIKPLFLDISAPDAFDRALAISRSMGWKIDSSAKDEGRIEATATTMWMGFKDDIVIRVKKSGSGSKVDIRSESRVGIGDFGTNAARIRAFLKAMQKQ